jgi:spermidine synthase
LVGGGIGALLIVPLLYVLDGPTIVIFIAFLAALSSFFFSLGYQNRFKIISGILTIFLSGFLFLNFNEQVIKVVYVKGKKETNLIYQKWSPVGRVVVSPMKEKTIHAWGLSQNYKPERYPEQLQIMIDGAAGTNLEKITDNLEKDLEHLKYDITSLAYYIAPPSRSLIIGFGGGKDILTSLLFNFKEIEGVEINPVMKEIICHRFKDYSGKICQMKNVKLVTAEGRSYLNQSILKYSLIHLSLIDSWAATVAGAYALSENSLYTKEAFLGYFRHLEENGILTISRFVFQPPQQTIRALSLCRAALEEIGVQNFEKNIMIFKTPVFYNKDLFVSNLMCKKSAFTNEEIKKAEGLAEDMGFDIIYTPLNQKDNYFTKFILAGDLKQFYKNYPFRIEPPTDNEGFFFHMLKLKDFWRVFNFKNIEGGQLHNYYSVFILITILIIASLLSLFFIFLPLLFRQAKFLVPKKEALKYILYFAFLGLGFMLIEISLIQRFSIFFGHPVYSIIIALFSILLFSGIGSLLTSKLNIKISQILFVLILTGVIFLIVSFSFFKIEGPLISKSFLATLFLAPLGLFMGMPFPCGINLLDKRDHQLIPWAFGINCITSTIGSVLTLILYINSGFRITFLVALIFYLFAFFIIKKLE